MLRLYSLIWYLLLPLILLRLWWKGRYEPGYRHHILERFSFYKQTPYSTSRLIWVHAVSVGETRAAQPLINSLLKTYPDARILLSHMTPTGRATGGELFKHHDSRLQQIYLPYDIVSLMRRMLLTFKPVICLLMETELWPNLIAQCYRHKVPVVLVSARLSARSYDRGQRFSTILGPAVRKLTLVAAQTRDDARRFELSGVKHVEVTGSVKFDVVAPANQIARGERLRTLIGSRNVFLCASTREGEEQLILQQFTKTANPDILLILVPRHPQRFNEVERLCENFGLKSLRRSQLPKDFHSALIPLSVQILLGDSMGEIFTYCAASDVVFVGGNLLPFGGHNPIEPCILGKPVLFGTNTFNFAQLCADAVEANAAIRVEDAQDLIQTARRLFLDEQSRAIMGEHAKNFAQLHQGAVDKTLNLLRPFLEKI